MRFLLLFFLCIGCSTTGYLRPVLSTKTNYQKDLKMVVSRWDGEGWLDGQEIIGMGVVPKAKGYRIKIYPPGEVDMISLVSCHRELKTPNPKRRGGWFSKKYYEFEVWPTEEHEVNKACSFEAGAYEKDKGRHAWGLIAIEDERATLNAVAKCNGQTLAYNGTSVCQAKKGLFESIHFTTPVIATQIKGCEIKEPPDKKNWVYQMPSAECTIYFIDQDNAAMIHKSVLFGYDTIPIRGVE